MRALPVWGISLTPKGITLSGAFLLQVDYTIIHLDRFVRIGIGDNDFSTIWMNLELRTEGGNHFGIAASGGWNVPSEPYTTDNSGSMRIVRDTTGIVTAYFKDASRPDWTTIGTANQGTSDLKATLGFWCNGDSFSGENNQVAFDNFYAISSTVFVVPEYQYGALIAIAACFAAFVIIKKPKLNLKHK